jgi:2-methylcitrate dehydratase PrpD
MSQAIEDLARFVSTVTWDAIPPDVQDHAKLVLLDTLGVILAGSEAAEVAALREQLLADGGHGATVYARGFPAADPRTAALLNGTAGRTPELCETHRFVSSQSAVQALPAILAAAERHGGDGRAILTALVVGHEVAVRVGAGATARRLAHQNGQWPMLGAVAAVARLRDFDPDQMSLALRLGATFILTPSYTNVAAGATVLNVAGGMCGPVGLLAADLALAGFAAQPDAVDQAFAELVGDGFAPERVTEELGQRWEIARNHFRLRGCCNPIYAALDALEAALADLNPRPDDIERIDVATYAFASVMREPDPPNAFASRYSLPHAAAAIAARGQAGYTSFNEDALHDPAIAALRHRVHVAEDPELSKLVPRLKPARVTVTLRDGRQATRACESARGDFQQPYTRDELRAKFRELAGLVLTERGVAGTEALMGRFEHAERVDDLLRVLRANSR